MDAHLARALEAIDDAVGPLDAATIGRPADGRWSIAEILEHLTLAFTGTSRAMEKALASGETRGRRPSLLQSLIRILVLQVGYFPRAEAPEGTVPSRSIPPERSHETIREALIGLDAVLSRASERFGDRTLVVNHPYFRGLTIPQWRKLHWRHTVHHMRQVRERAAS